MIIARKISLLFVIVCIKDNISAEYDNSWIAYKEQPCCLKTESHHVRHGKDHVREFSCGKLYYRTFYADEDSDSLYVGSMDRVFRLNMNNVNHTDCQKDSLVLEPNWVASCVSRGKSEQFECRNHIRVIQPIGDGKKLYICGTNAYNPKDWIVHSNLTHLGRNTFIPGIGLGIAKCPYDPLDNSTAVWVEKGNPGNLPGLYSGTNVEFTNADAVIFRTDLYNFTSGRKEYNFKRTLKYDSMWLDKPHFVGSFEMDDHVLFFFRETAVEYINCGKSIYSRVARVCKKDTGGKNILHHNWATYIKARLNCSIPGEYPFYFNEIQSVYRLARGDTTFFATFTTLTNGLMGSAVCAFRLSDIEKAFGGKFKEQASSVSAWLPVLSNRVPEPRPGTCVNDTETLPNSVLNFIRLHPLMDSAVSHENERPIFFKKDLVFTRIVVDQVNVDLGGMMQDYFVIYAGTVEGSVYKVVYWRESNRLDSSSILLDVFHVTEGEAIQVMELSKKHKALYVASDHRIKQIDLVICHQYDSCLRCVRDPYCGWNKEEAACSPYSPGQLELRLQHGDYIFFNMYRSDKYIETSQHGLVILSAQQEDSGQYDCFVGTSLLCSYEVNIDFDRCLSPNQNENYQKIYADWCREFEKYKQSRKTWEKKEARCAAKRINTNKGSSKQEELRKSQNNVR
ncbi:semaphorin-2A [Agrilus planipennis]|uniref:Semaphorin-2A n=1 Tax=Agrilus planipennis TaxID=224129 RepID=A0A7F5R854_AGRPL|nr:semaphorin-2A [Agrilus planipennis]